MKNQLFQILAGFFIAIPCFAQQKISIIKPASGKTLSFQASNASGNIDASELSTKDIITISPDPGLINVDYVLHIEKADGADVTGSLIPDKTTGIVQDANGKVLFLTIKAKGYDDLVINDIGKGVSGGQSASGTTGNQSKNPKTVTATDYILSSFKPTQYSFHDLKTLITTNKRYYSSSDEAFIILDENGRLIGNVPVNIDQDDKIYIYLIIDGSDIDKYDVEVIGGEYSPVDLQIRSYEPINKGSLATQGSKLPSKWTVIRFDRGPYTSENVTFNVKKTDRNKDNEDETTTISTYTLKINKLYHVAVGASFISTNLAKPDFDVFPLTDSTNTINTLNNGNRTAVTVNVIWYWQNTFKYFRNGSDVTRGRDVLKEPNWITRLNPTFGVTLDNAFDENFFVGGTYEFARGGSFIFGGHYGKVKELADSKFELGETTFTGSQTDIKLTDAWKWGFFFGITLDTRIFNKLIARN